jgi:sporulation protein YlmC with PRC-barrel domain
MRLELGRSALLADGSVRDLVDVVIDAANNRVTHVVVQPEERSDEARLVPMELVEAGAGMFEVNLSCTSETLDGLEAVHEQAFLHAGESAKGSSEWDVGVEDLQPMSQYGAGAFGEIGPDLTQDVFVTYDLVPKGEVELRHASPVYSADRHHLGRVDGVVVDSGERITHVLFERGHLWWRHELVVPTAAVSKFETDMVVLGVTKSELGAVVDGKR